MGARALVQDGRRPSGEVLEDDGFELGVGEGGGAAGEGDDGGDGPVGEELGEDFGADEARGACEDDFHFGGDASAGVEELDVEALRSMGLQVFLVLGSWMAVL